MPDSRKVMPKSKVTINTISDNIDTRDNAGQNDSPRLISSPDIVIRSHTLNYDEEHPNQRISFNKRQSRGKRVSNAGRNSNVESICLQETSERPANLKASFLRRKMQEYEGNKKSFFKQFCFTSLSHAYNSFVISYFISLQCV